MGKKKERPNAGAPAARQQASGGSGRLLTAVGLIAAAAVGGWLLIGGNSATTTANSTASSTAEPQPDARVVARTEALAKLGPRKHATLPPIPFQGYAPPRPPEVITAAYRFAADHPEILGYIPCFCGCERSGHTGNTDCFVKQRDANGDVLAWDEHGVECAVCIDVANRSRQMYESGATVRAIRAAIDKEFGKTTMPTPPPPAAAAHGSH